MLAYKTSGMESGFRGFRKEFKDTLRKENPQIATFRDNVPQKVNAETIDKYRTKIEANLESEKGMFWTINFKLFSLLILLSKFQNRVKETWIYQCDNA